MKGQMEPERTETFDVLLVIELQVDVFDVCELGCAHRSNRQTQSTHLEHCNADTLSKGTTNL